MFWFQLLLIRVLIKPYLRAQRRRRVGTRMKDRIVQFAWLVLCC